MMYLHLFDYMKAFGDTNLCLVTHLDNLVLILDLRFECKGILDHVDIDNGL